MRKYQEVDIPCEAVVSPPGTGSQQTVDGQSCPPDIPCEAVDCLPGTVDVDDEDEDRVSVVSGSTDGSSSVISVIPVCNISFWQNMLLYAH